MGDDQVQLGGNGEAIFRRWAKQGGFTVNQAIEDAGGWDFLLEFPGPTSPATLDQRPRGPSCFVQVKATQNISRPIRVKLSNWEKLVKHPLPAFFVVIQVDCDGEAERAYVVHVDEPWMTEVLRKLRELDDTVNADIRREHLPLTYRPEEELAKLTGHCLRDRRLPAMGNDPFAYAQRKRHLVEHLGYEDHPYRVKFTLPEQSRAEAFDAMANLAIGAVDHLPVAAVTAHEVRFGLKRAVRELEGINGARIQLTKRERDGDARVEVYDETTGERVALNAEVRLSQTVFPFLPPEHRKVAFSSPEASFVVTPNGGPQMATLTWHLNLPQPGAVADISRGARSARLMRLLDAKSHNLHVRITSEEFDADIPATRLAPGMNSRVLEYAGLIEQADTVMSAFGIPPDTRVDPAVLLRQRDNLRLLSLLARPGLGEMEVRGLLTNPIEEPANVGQAAGLYSPFLRVGDLILVVIVAFVGAPGWEMTAKGQWMIVKTHSPRVMARRILRSEAVPFFHIGALFDEVESTLQREGVSLVLRPSDDRAGKPARKSRKGKPIQRKLQRKKRV